MPDRPDVAQKELVLGVQGSGLCAVLCRADMCIRQAKNTLVQMLSPSRADAPTMNPNAVMQRPKEGDGQRECHYRVPARNRTIMAE